MARRPPSKDLETLLAEQVAEDARRAERARAMEELTVERAVLFTDIVGSTEFFEKNGDVAGMTMLKRHDALLHPLVPAHGGKIVKTIGDAIMAVFEDPLSAVRCGVAMQKVLQEERERREDEPLRVRIGIHAGKVFQKGEDYFGDTVNTAARINHEARPDEVLLSKATHQRIPATEGLKGIPRGSAPLKGKTEPVPLIGISVVSAEAGTVIQPEVGPIPAMVPVIETSAELFVLELQVGARGLKVTAIDGATDKKGTVKAYEEQPFAPADLAALAAGFETFMSGTASSYRDRIRERGEDLFKRALSERARKHLTGTALHYLRLQLDDDLVHVPWELLHDGRQFLGLRFAAGRIVSARGEGASAAASSRHGHALVVSNASGDLPSAAIEGKGVAGLLREGFVGEVRHLEGPVTRAAFFQALRGCALLHFAGHSQPSQGAVRGGFQLSDGLAAPDDVVRACGNAPPPLVFANSCSSSTKLGWTEAASRTFNIASALLMRGTQHYIGPMWDVPDEDAFAFALRFYEQALTGVPFAEATRLARAALYANGKHPLSFAGYVLYGEPRTAFGAATVRLARNRERMRSGTPDALPIENMLASPGVRSAASIPSALGGLAGTVPPLPANAHPVFHYVRWVLVAGAIAGVVGRGILGYFDILSAGKKVTAAVAGTAAGTPVASPASSTAPSAQNTQVAMLGSATRHDGPVRLAVFPFKDLTDDPRDRTVHIPAAMQEAIITGMHEVRDVSFVEKGQEDLNLNELDWTWTKKLVVDGKEVSSFNRETLAAVGRLQGAEVLVIGAYQRNGNTMRANARFVNAETGEVLDTLKVDRSDGDLFRLEDGLAEATKKSLGSVKKRMRPAQSPNP